MNIDVQMADFILPLLRSYYKNLKGRQYCPQIVKDECGDITEELAAQRWKEIVFSMIRAFDCTYSSRDDIFPVDEIKIAEGFENFGNYFRNLWG